eukprot:CAMPEP_0176497120 /NCGR_PEP_ID=MMETSP0200_2-20121128/11550_1 /TAXON_ID=947934 /ORGANISM="Chaetoceros sp., Strain GSL56" /LENGTH=957 /DNA_ID=CAMNT_0017895103 /DNA_START=90 /DNA_END=2959 /DNA_ORIENTATION=+
MKATIQKFFVFQSLGPPPCSSLSRTGGAGMNSSRITSRLGLLFYHEQQQQQQQQQQTSITRLLLLFRNKTTTTAATTTTTTTATSKATSILKTSHNLTTDNELRERNTEKSGTVFDSNTDRLGGGNELQSTRSSSKSSRPPSCANIVIVGGGIIGTSVAYHLGKLGIKNVILLERDKLTSGTTWHAAGLINTFGSLSVTSTSMRMYTKKLYSTILPEETSMDTGFYPVGFIELACDEHRLEYYRRVASLNRYCGVEVDEISPREVKDKFPLVETSDVLKGFYVKDDGRVNPYEVTMALAKGAKLFGVQIYEDVSVKGVSKSNYLGLCSMNGKAIKDAIPRVTGVVLDNGDEIEANIVVNCTGMWARQFGERCGVHIPNQAAEHYYLITDAMEEVDPSWPVVEDSSRCVYIRPEGGGLMLGLFERIGAPWCIEEIPETFSFGEIEPDWDRMGPYLQEAMERVPMTLHVGAKKFFCGPESFTPDGSPIVGETPELKNYYVAAGLNSIGILTGGGIGKLLASWIRAKRSPSDFDVTGINVDRFQSYQCNPNYRADRVGEILGETYKVHYPDHYLSSCRDIKKSPLHAEMASHNAFFRDVSGWESPAWFAPPHSKPQIDSHNFGRQSFFSHWESEHKACRENVALFDMSFMSKFIVCGDDAGRFLNHLSTANVDGKKGRITYTQWLNRDGYVEADLTVSKIDDDQYLVVATDTMHNHVLTHMKRHLTNQMHVFVHDVTNAYAQINLQGPNSRKLLQSVTSFNLDNENFPFRSVTELDIGYGKSICTRITYVGELGYEIFIPVEFANHVYNTIASAGKGFNLKHAGLKALGSLRLEKGYRDYGHDIDNTDKLVEVGLGFTCDFKKDDGFIGMENVLKQKNCAKRDGGLRKSMAQVLLSDPKPLLHSGEVLWRNGQRIGEVRSASYGHTLGGAVGLCMLESTEPILLDKGFIEEGEWVIEHGT